MYLFNRTKTCTVQLLGEELQVHVLFLDTVHEMTVEIAADLNDLTIKRIKLNMIRTPFKFCRTFEGKINDLVGLPIGPGISKAVSECIGGSEGCYHLADSFLDGIKALKLGRYAWINMNKDKNEKEKFYRKELGNTCYYYSHGKNTEVKDHADSKE